MEQGVRGCALHNPGAHTPALHRRISPSQAPGEPRAIPPTQGDKTSNIRVQLGIMQAFSSVPWTQLRLITSSGLLLLWAGASGGVQHIQDKTK